ncbi:MAG: CDP-2,3-bis-(O-geranylgeranyl)-sn-glycerol synthase [Methanosphaera sp.]|uniref:CDP-2,3-bis-(O-geranylgeranyl)-sn-glycerol synthase n=1 Tax=Methanosphaera sp. ISO3-F5 TaxID=1452353 RepID=UPI002B257012|nr:CDP-2,3-bis-(O-geranylgeranyl)-sn-glycerol synthase [Methanosphaera sp. ISO3-F5]MBR0472771.1 CDP-2,3-bis-(O-geranylgeranyl)-sn-glycerol synthase [Methanosphaera sp.]WQH63215.1 CDP-2,3-bis-(O-geranylgeranyl)-sn-glycerol synthase [Methanosphaera sp. ISO3-F5]
MDFILTVLYSIYLMIPAYFANGSALVFGGGTPIDFGKNAWDGRRFTGDGCTWRGLIGGGLLGMIVGGLLGLLADYGILSTLFNISSSQITFLSGNVLRGLLIGFLLGFGALIGDIIGSFIKRRLNFERGKPVPLLDQLDFVIVSLLFVSIVIKLSWEVILIILILSIFFHLGANIFAYAIKLKDVWY